MRRSYRDIAYAGACDLSTQADACMRETSIPSANSSDIDLSKSTTIMPAKSKKQQMAAGAALAAKRGEKKASSLKGASKQMAKSMSERELHDMAETKRSKLPTKK